MDDQAGPVIATGAPGRLLAVAIPTLAVALVASSAARGGLEQTADDVVAPGLVAIVTVVVAVVLAARASSQRVELGGRQLRCRNLTTSFAIDWDDVDELVVRRRPMVVQVDVRARHHRRSHRLGAATRFSGPSAVQVLALLGAHDRAGGVLDDSGS